MTPRCCRYSHRRRWSLAGKLPCWNNRPMDHRTRTNVLCGILYSDKYEWHYYVLPQILCNMRFRFTILFWNNNGTTADKSETFSALFKCMVDEDDIKLFKTYNDATWIERTLLYSERLPNASGKRCDHFSRRVGREPAVPRCQLAPVNVPIFGPD